jgi:hypothetical protein
MLCRYAECSGAMQTTCKCTKVSLKITLDLTRSELEDKIAAKLVFFSSTDSETVFGGFCFVIDCTSLLFFDVTLIGT